MGANAGFVVPHCRGAWKTIFAISLRLVAWDPVSCKLLPSRNPKMVASEGFCSRCDVSLLSRGGGQSAPMSKAWGCPGSTAPETNLDSTFAKLCSIVVPSEASVVVCLLPLRGMFPKSIKNSPEVPPLVEAELAGVASASQVLLFLAIPLICIRALAVGARRD